MTRKQKPTIIIVRINSLYHVQEEFQKALLNILYIENMLYMLKQEKKVDKFQKNWCKQKDIVMKRITID